MTAEYDSALAALQDATDTSLEYIDASQALTEEVANKMTTIDDTLTAALASSQQTLQSYLNSSQASLASALTSNQASLDSALDVSQTTLETHLASISRKNFLINGKPQVWQRGESFTETDETSLYTADRWLTVLSNATCTKDADPQKGVLLTVDAEGGYGQLHQLIESATVQLLREKTVTLSVNYAVNDVFTGDMQLAVFYSNTGDTDADVLMTETVIDDDDVEIETSTALFSSTFTPVPATNATESISFVVPADAVGLRVAIIPVPSTIEDENGATTETSQVIGSQLSLYQAQLEVGTTASAFGVTPYGEEYQKCLRYYYSHTGAHYTHSYKTSGYNTDVYFPMVMRTTPSIVPVFSSTTFDVAIWGGTLDTASKFHMNSGDTCYAITAYTADAEL